MAVAALQSSGDSTVQVHVCSRDPTTMLEITLPADGATYKRSDVTVKGQVSYLSRIEFSVDNVSRSTLQLGSTAVSFEQPLSLSTGTHTISAVAYDSCGKLFVTKTISMTIETSDTSSRDTNTRAGSPESPRKSPVPVVYHDSSITPKPSGGNDRDAGAGTGDQDAPGQVSPLDTLLGNLDLRSTFRDFGTILRGALALTGAVLMLAPRTLAIGFLNRPLIGYPYAVYKRTARMTKNQKLHLLQKISLERRLLGVLLIFLAFIL